MNRQRKKRESRVKMVFLILLAVIVVGAAVYVVGSVIGKISSDYSHLDTTTTEQASDISIDTNQEPTVGWNETDEGWKYYVDKKNFLADQWKDIGGFLYHFGKDGIMTTGTWKDEGQIFTLHDTKGYLKDIQTDPDYVPEKTGENLDSLVRTNAFWCYLEDSDSTDPFKTILYRRTVEKKVLPLGGEASPERTTKNSMRAYGDYVYYLPKVNESQYSRLTETEKGLCDKLFRMIPGRDTKELIADQVGGYLVLGDTIYYSQGGSIHTATSGTEMPTGEAGYSVTIKDDGCYLVDGSGSPAVAESGNTVSVGDRVYMIDDDGRIKKVTHGPVTVNGKTYNLGGSGTNASVTVEQDGSNTTLIREKYGVQSDCIVDNSIFYSSYVDMTANGEWYSRIFKTDLDGKNKQAVSEEFPGTMSNLYYYEGEGQIYGEYYPAVWKQAYGEAVIISQDGSIYKIDDTSERSGSQTDGNDMLEIVMAKDGKVICMWNDCKWTPSTGITGIIWSKAIELDASQKTLIHTAGEKPEEESSAPEETNSIVRPVTGQEGSGLESSKPGSVQPGNANPGSAQPGNVNPGSAKPGSVNPGSAQPGNVNPGSAKPGSSKPGSAQPETGRPPSPSINNNPLIGTGKPGDNPGTSLPTVPPAPESSGEVRVVPLE